MLAKQSKMLWSSSRGRAMEGDVRDMIEAGQSTAGIFARTGIM
jgi:hypothetical protein